LINSRIVTTTKMGSILSRITAIEVGNSNSSLKLEAQRIKEFSGSYEEWPKWKSRTICAFDGSGYERILSDRQYATTHLRMNKIVFSQLAVATVDGTAHHLIKEHEENKDGHAAWMALAQWFDGDAMKNETSESLRTKLESLTLHSGTTASQYVNKFLMWFRELERIPGEGYSPNHGVYLFLKNVLDTEYAPTVVFLRNNNATLNECVVALRKSERDLAGKRTERRRFRSVARRMRSSRDDSTTDDDSSVETPPRKKQKRVRRLTGELQTTKNGYIILPTQKWKDLSDTERSLIQSFNAKTKHGEAVDGLQWPDGVTIVSKARRVKESSTEPATEKNEKKKKKKISFHLQESEENGSEEES
jgi:hypothetical protein